MGSGDGNGSKVFILQNKMKAEAKRLGQLCKKARKSEIMLNWLNWLQYVFAKFAKKQVLKSLFDRIFEAQLLFWRQEMCVVC